MDIPHHILELLKVHDCVVIPDFGGFIANYVPASIETGQSSILPPAKEVIFNPKINKNDGILIQYLAETEGMTYQQAKDSIQTFRDQAISKLYHGETILFDDLGSIRLDHKGNWVFQAGHPQVNIDTFGLPPLTLTETRFREPVISIPHQHSIKLPKDNRHLIPVAASILLLLALALFPITGKMPELVQTSNINMLNTLAETPDTQPAAVEMAQPTVVEENNSTEIQVAKLPYIIVGGSFTHLKNAETLFNELKSQGYHPELYELKNGWYRVTVDTYNSWNEALAAMENYKTAHPGSTVWVSKR